MKLLTYSRISLKLICTIALFTCNLISKEQERPNFIFLMADDLGYGDTGFNGNKIIKTPHLDNMAKEGARFTHFYSIGPVCAPTRGSALTGRHYMRYGMMDVNVGKLPHQEITIARLCKQQGYTTGHFGKWHLGTLSKTESPRHKNPAKDFAPPWERDYDDAFATEISVPTWDPAAGRYPKHDSPYWHNGQKVTDNLLGDDSRVIMDRAIPFIRKAVTDKKSFMTTIWFHTPHSPVVAGPEYLKMYEGYKEGEQHYYGCITAMDEQIGRLREELRKLNVDQNTIIWFCSDNGPEGRGNPKKKYDAYHGAFYGTAGKLRGRKRSLYNGGVCVPALVSWPGKIDAGKVINTPCSTLDYLESTLAQMNVKYPDSRPLDGENIIPILLGKTNKRNKPIIFASKISSPKASIIQDDYKFCSNLDGKNKDELYHLHDDFSESKNIIKNHQERSITMKKIIYQWLESCNKSFYGNDYKDKYEVQGSFLKYNQAN